MPAEHVMLCYLGAGESDEILHLATELCTASGARLSVLLPVVETAHPDGCCGIQGDHWRRLMDEETRDAAHHAESVLMRLGCPPENVNVDAGRSIPDIAVAAAERLRCDAVAVGRKRRPWSGGGLSHRQLKALRRAAPGRVIELTPDRRGTPTRASPASSPSARSAAS